MDTILGVPYSSQYLDVTEKIQSLTACGITSLYMILKYYKIEGISLDNLVETGIRDGGYSKSGWLHDYLVTVFNKNGIECQRKENMRSSGIEEIRDSLRAGNPVIISMQRFSFERRIFHMVVLVGIRENEKQEIVGFFYHDPAGLIPADFTNLFVSVGVFFQYWRKMAIFPKNNTPTCHLT